MVLSWITVASGFLEWYGVLIYLALIASTIFGISREDRKPPLMAVRPYFGMMLMGFFLLCHDSCSVTLTDGVARERCRRSSVE